MLLATVNVPSFEMPAPLALEFWENVLLVTFACLELSMPPPSVARF